MADIDLYTSNATSVTDQFCSCTTQDSNLPPAPNQSVYTAATSHSCGKGGCGTLLAVLHLSFYSRGALPVATMRDIRSLDFFRKIPRDLTEGTVSGASLSCVGTFFLVILIILEFNSYLGVRLKRETAAPCGVCEACHAHACCLLYGVCDVHRRH